MVVPIATLKSYFETGDKPSQVEWNNLFDTLAALQAKADTVIGAGVDLSQYLVKSHDDSTPFVLAAKQFKIGTVDGAGLNLWNVNFDAAAFQYFDFDVDAVLTFAQDLTISNMAGRSITLFGRNTDSASHSIGLNAANGAPAACYVTNGVGLVVVPAGKRLTVTVTVLKSSTVAVAYGVQL